MEQSDILSLLISAGLGLLVGLQRERNRVKMAGIRTFTLITLFGTLSGLISRYFDNTSLVALGALSIALLFGFANFLKKTENRPDIGQTTEIAGLVMFAIGAYLAIGDPILGIVAGAMVVLLLHLKEYLSSFAARIGEKDMEAIMTFVAVSLIVLPVLPNENFGPYEILNLREIWLMVVLIVGISITAYFAYKWLGDSMGTGLSGILGGLISSTATTVIYARQSKNVEAPNIRALSFILVTASTVAFFRVILEVGLVVPSHFSQVAPPILSVAFLMCLTAVVLFLRQRKDAQRDYEPDNPAQLKTALLFAAIYALLLLAIAFVKNEFGTVGLYPVAFISGLTDMDAITLSLSNMMNDQRIDPELGWKLILVAALSNLLFKGGLAISLGSPGLRRTITPLFLFILVAGTLVLLFW